MKPSIRRLASFVVAVASSGARLLAQGPNGDSAAPNKLPLHEVPTSIAGRQLAFLITGDGGFAPGDHGIAETFAKRGIPTIALNAREYLGTKRSPDRAADDAVTILRRYLATWHRDSVMIVGYSRGADMAPFIVTRLPSDLRERVSLVAMIGLGERASFEFHWSDLIKDTKRATDYLVSPEITKIRDVHMLCLYGEDETGSLCPSLSGGVITVDKHNGKHALSRGEGASVAQRILRELAAEDSGGD
jgi:type IV secretory pathway VirJ component